FEDSSTGVSGDHAVVGNFDSGSVPDLLAGTQSPYSLHFGDGSGSIATTETASLGEGGVFWEFEVVDLPGSPPSDDALVVDNCVGAIATTGTEGEGYLDAVAYVRCGPSYSPTDAVLARLEASGSVIAWANGADGVLSLTSIVYAAGSVTFG